MTNEYELTDLGATEYGALVLDRKRIDWMDKYQAEVFLTVSSKEFVVQVVDNLDIRCRGRAPTLRAAIDAAMGGAK